jgi:multidrug efflux pump subunit AcrA (membrane-fusion protein)
MSWKRKVRVGSFALGVLLMVGMLVGARLLSPGSGGGGSADGSKAAPPPQKNGTGPIVHGVVDSDPSPVAHGLAPVLPSGGLVTKVFVKEDQQVKEGDELYAFDTTILEAERRIAQQNVAVVQAKVHSAQAAADNHQTQIDIQKVAIESAQLVVKTTQEALTTIEYQTRRKAKASHGPDTPEERIAQEVNNDPDVLRSRIDLQKAQQTVKVEQAKLAGLEKADVQAQVAEARAAVELAKANLQKAEDAVKQCTVRAKVSGTVERVTVSPGDTIGLGTRTPAVILIPNGRRIVRAEVEPEFAAKVGKALEGKANKELTIYDNTDPTLTYRGHVQAMGGSFLTKRSAGESLAPSDTRVLEVRIVVDDPAPTGKPPLLVGQKVKVNFGE